MKLQEKIKRRLDLYISLIKQRKEIKRLYYSFDESAKKDFRSILKFNLIRSLKPYFYSRGRKGNTVFTAPKRKLSS